ncbi:putative F-box domain, galactose oxidase, beta-propeller, F-box associated interaction [Rosa chinensis]|uniref:Putative F-box domain, galactose oxidase, beta-propeller, F-box associated interaction n=1 Tax=Rosa chinensis TaxID=74649 RepID=A0A2P6Q263_ROSCH|nr:F-box protein CPR1 [Rosa chinensis]PRQ28282.1 putative F-box domain, galactose oxidase, beta-propeller, F-box associated interaction [Rosa chinensis]
MKSAEEEPSTDAQHRQIQAFLAELPPEVIINILSRLHVGRLLCFRSVARPWRSLIDSSYFKNLHLLHSTETKSNLTLILRKDSDLYCVDFDSLNDAVELNHPLMCYSNRIRVLGSCNGLLCICNVAEDIALWSPWIKKYRILPSLPSDRKRDKGMCLCGARVYGLGYDAVHDDYKLVRISQFIGWDYASFESEVKVYSLRMNAWRKVDDMPYVLCYTRKMGILVSGSVHWVVTRSHEVDQPATELVIGFDVEKERFGEVPMPEMDRKCQIDVGYLEGCLCIIAKYEDMGVDVWTIKQYGVKETWCKLFTVKQAQGVRRPKSIKPLVYSKNRRQVLLEQNHEDLVWFDLESQMVNKIKIRGLPDLFEAIVCAETLVPVDPSKREDKEKEGKKNKKRDDFLAEGFKLVL